MSDERRKTPGAGLTRKGFLGRLGAGAALATVGATVLGAGSAAGRGLGLRGVVPAPVSVGGIGAGYEIGSETKISVLSAGAAGVAGYLGDLLRPSTGYRLPLVEGPARGPAGAISLALSGAPREVGAEGYRMRVGASGVELRAGEPAGLFAGVQTLRQLLPASVEEGTRQPGPWEVPGVEVLDYPRFGYRGAHLDVARHFFGVEAVKRFVDGIALYKMNHLHLHLTDDQGWRIQIDSWPRLTEYGGSTEVDGGPGGYYTKAEYAEIVEYARERHVTVVPEIDMPGHTNAALASYPELNCDGKAPDLYTGIDVGFSSLCVEKEVTYRFVEDVVREVAEMTPGPYLHIGGDEADRTSAADYARFMRRVVPIVERHGKRSIGWHQVVEQADPPASVVAQYWDTGREAPEVAAAAGRGTEIILSPADRAYLDMKYDENTELGLDWAGHSEVRDAYVWGPGCHLRGVDEVAVLGVESGLWSETLETIEDVEFMAFPRLPGIAELGWSPSSETNWQDYKHRLAAQAPRWDALGTNYYRSPQVPWSV